MSNDRNVKFMINKNCVTVSFDSKYYTFNAPSKEYDDIKCAIKDKDYDRIPDLVDIATKISEASDGFFSVVDGLVHVDGKPCPDTLSNRILEFRDEGLPIEPLVNFAKKANKNPSYHSRQQLFEFLDKNKHPITDDGNFIAYKKVRNDFLDIYSGTFDNTPGNVVEMNRADVNDDPTQTCSNGLHVSAFNYCCHSYGSVGQPILEVEVDPADVVSVPVDYNGEKMRVCRYKVLGVVEEPNPAKLIDRRPPVNTQVNPCDDCEGTDEIGDPIDCEDCEHYEDEEDRCVDRNCEACYPPVGCPGCNC